jgi:2-hydroxychromene-2-carboxylate isomerase
MAKVVDYYHFLQSPYAYLGVRFTEIAARHGATVNVIPIAPGKVFPVSGGLPLPKRAPQRQAYRLVELARWRDHLGLPLNLEPRFFPADDRQAARMVVAARRGGQDALALSNAVLRAVWAEERDIADPDTLAAIAGEAGFDAAALVTAAADPAVEADYESGTEAAIAAGVFGSPTYIIDGDMFWGQDRLDFVERALAG